MPLDRPQEPGSEGNSSFPGQGPSEEIPLKSLPRLLFRLEELPYGASRLLEGRIARWGVELGVAVMATGAAIFSLGWWRKWYLVVDAAFVVTLLGWMTLIVSLAFWIVQRFAKRFPPKDPPSTSQS